MEIIVHLVDQVKEGWKPRYLPYPKPRFLKICRDNGDDREGVWVGFWLVADKAAESTARSGSAIANNATAE